MVHEYKLIEVDEAHLLRDRLDLLDEAYYLDRSTFRPIRGVENHETGTYQCVGDASLPKDLLVDLIKISPKKPLPLSKIVINKYDVGDWIPKHCDDHGPAYFTTLHLEDSDEGLSYEGGFSKNKAGWTKEYPTDLIHWVEPVIKPRYTIIYLYDRGIGNFGGIKI